MGREGVAPERAVREVGGSEGVGQQDERRKGKGAHGKRPSWRGCARGADRCRMGF